MVGTTVRYIATYSIAMNWMMMPRERERLRPMKSTRKNAQMSADTNLTTPNMAVAKSFSDEPVTPRVAKN